MKPELHPDAQPVIDAFLANGGKSFEQVGDISTLRSGYETNCGLAAMQGLEHIQSRDITAEWQGEPVHLRLYDEMPDADARPVVVFLHGGGWVIGNLNTHDSICRKIAAHAACRVIAVNYRLAPEHKFPVPFNDCKVALDYIIQHAEQLGINVHQMVFAGDSAGANMAALLGQNFSQQHGFALKAQVLLYPVVGVCTQTQSYAQYQSGFPLVQSTMLWFFDALFSQPEEYAQISLLNQPFLKANGDIFLLTLEHDPLRDEALLYLEKALQHGLNVEYHHLGGLMHGIFTIAGKLPVAEQYLERAAQFIAGKFKEIGRASCRERV